jgi:subfamily B ATP-binding cassette protein MsbA
MRTRSLNAPRRPAARLPVESAARMLPETRALVLRFFREMVRPDLARLVVTLVLMAVVAGVTGLYPLAIDYAFELLAERDPRAAWLLPPLVVGLTALKGGALYAQMISLNTFLQRIGVRFRNALFAHLMRADLSRLMRDATGGLVARFTYDVQVVCANLGQVTTSLARDLLTVVALLAAMLWLDWAMTLIVLVVYPLAAVPIARLSRRMRRIAQSMQTQVGGVTSFLYDGLAGVRMVKAYRLEDYQKRRADEAFRRMAQLRLKAETARARVDPLLEVMGGLAVGGVLAIGGWRVAQGAGTVGDFTGFVTALLMAAQPVRGLGKLNVTVQEGLAALQRAFALLDEEPRIRDRPHARPLRLAGGAVRFERVSFAYEDAAPAVHDVSFAVPPGRTTALVGPSGAGKTTILNLVPRFFEPTAGRVLVDDQDLRDVTLASLRDAVALVSQEVVLFDDTVRANIAFGRPEADDAAIRAAARAADAEDFVSALEHGFDTLVGPRGERLSGGQRQRLALARAILKDAPILLLDEATSALDTESEQRVQAALARLSRGRTTLVIAHRLATVRDAAQIVVLDRGRVVEIGDHRELVARGGVYARLAAVQFRDELASDASPRL